MKKWLSLLLAVVMVLSLVACGGKDTTNSDTGTKNETGKNSSSEEESESSIHWTLPTKTERIVEYATTYYSYTYTYSGDTYSGEQTLWHVFSSVITFTYDGDRPQSWSGSEEINFLSDNDSGSVYKNGELVEESSVYEETGSFEVTDDRLIIYSDYGTAEWSTALDIPRCLSSNASFTAEWDNYGCLTRRLLVIYILDRPILNEVVNEINYVDFNSRNQPTKAIVEQTITNYDYNTLEAYDSYENTLEWTFKYDAQNRLIAFYEDGVLVKEYSYTEQSAGRTVTIKSYNTDGQVMDENFFRYVYD